MTKLYHFWFKQDCLNVVYRLEMKSKAAVKKYVKEKFGTVRGLVIDG